MSSSTPTDSTDKIFEIVTKRYEFELARSKDLDSKAGSIIGYVGVITTIVIGLGTFEIFDHLSNILYYLIYFGAIISFVVSISFCLFAIKVRKFRFSPRYDDIIHFYNNPTIELKVFLRTHIKEMSDAFKENFQVNEEKGKYILFGWVCFLAGMTMLLSYALILTLEQEIINKPSNQDNNSKLIKVSELYYLPETNNGSNKP